MTICEAQRYVMPMTICYRIVFKVCQEVERQKICGENPLRTVLGLAQDVAIYFNNVSNTLGLGVAA